jgi:hypothetical protein
MLLLRSAGVLVCTSAVANAANAASPNFLLIMTDDQGWGDVSYNCKNATICPRTPNLDLMAMGDNSIHFSRFYAGSGVCSPTRATFLTGRTNERGCVSGAIPCDHMVNSSPSSCSSSSSNALTAPCPAVTLHSCRTRRGSVRKAPACRPQSLPSPKR